MEDNIDHCVSGKEADAEKEYEGDDKDVNAEQVHHDLEDEVEDDADAANLDDEEINATPCCQPLLVSSNLC